MVTCFHLAQANPKGLAPSKTTDWATWEKQVDPKALSCRGPSGPLTLNFLIGPAPVFTKDLGNPFLAFPLSDLLSQVANLLSAPRPSAVEDPQLAPQLGIVWALDP